MEKKIIDQINSIMSSNTSMSIPSFRIKKILLDIVEYVKISIINVLNTPV